MIPSRPPVRPTTGTRHSRSSRPQLDALRAAFEREQKERQEHLAPPVQVSGFVQVDWVLHNQESQNEINGSTGAPLNEDRFDPAPRTPARRRREGLVLGAIEIDANTVNGPQVRPIEAQVSLRWPEKPDAAPAGGARLARGCCASRSATRCRRSTR